MPSDAVKADVDSSLPYLNRPLPEPTEVARAVLPARLPV